MSKNVNKTAVLAAAILGVFSVAPFVVTDASAQTRGSQWPNRDSTYGRTDNRSFPRNNNRYDPRRRDNRSLEGLVTQDRRGDDFIMRINNGQRVWVRANNTPRRLSEGDVVRVRGYFVDNNNRGNNRYSGRWDDRHVFRAENVQIVRSNNNRGYNNRGNYGGYNNSTFSFPATVLDSNSRLNSLRLRGENGREYAVSSRDANRWKKNDRIRVEGRVVNGVMVASNISRR